MVSRPRVQVPLRGYYPDHGHAPKDLIVLHETVSHNAPGTGDIKSPAAYLKKVGLGIHGLIDIEGNSGWTFDDTAILYHAASGQGRVNTRGIGFELISEVPLEPNAAKRRDMWDAQGPRKKQLDTLAQWIAHLAPRHRIPIKVSMSDTPGITTHWQVSKQWLNGQGHWDCWPVYKGGHFPLLYVVNKARQLLYRSMGV